MAEDEVLQPVRPAERFAKKMFDAPRLRRIGRGLEVDVLAAQPALIAIPGA
jgi:hypothetical protein